MKIAAFAPLYNTQGRHDATGAFQPEAGRYLAYHGASIACLYLFDNRRTKKEMRAAVVNVLKSRSGLDAIAFFCHGYKRGLQCGIDTDTARDLARAIGASSLWAGPAVTLYACDTGRDIDADRLDDLEQFGGDGGFADRLRDELCVAGYVHCRVDAHTTAGHTTRNPNVRRFDGAGSPVGGIGGYYIVPKGSKMWKKWRAALTTDFRFQFPFMDCTGIYEYLAKIK